MLTKWGIDNFKCLKDIDLSLAPLTILTGTNSSGKSSFIQSILLIAQTIRNSIGSRELVLNGPLVQLGSFEDIQLDSKKDIGINFAFAYWAFDPRARQGVTFSSDLSFSCIEKEPRLRLFDHKNEGWGHPFRNNHVLVVRNFGERNKLAEGDLAFDFANMVLEDQDTLEAEAQVVDFSLYHFLPYSYTFKIDDWSEEYPTSFFKDIISKYFSCRIKYLGPLRFLEANYPVSLADDPKDVGIKGEYTAAVIDEFCNKQIEYISPPTEGGTVKEGKLYDALISWLKYLGLAEEVRCSAALENNGYTLGVKIAANDKSRNLTRVGVGVSQVLPILTMCLLAESDDTLIIEEPDQHLHPRVQSRLVDFFIAMSQLNRQCIIETHSDHFIDKLRLRISQSLLEKNEEIKNSTKIYYFSKGEAETKATEIEINEYADYNVWPDGFFDEKQYVNEEILRNINTKMFNDKTDTEETDD